MGQGRERPFDAGPTSAGTSTPRGVEAAPGARRAADPRRALGARGEQLAAGHLEALGLRVLDRNFRTRDGELDLVARSERALVFCEVKTRVATAPLGPLNPLVAIGARKRRRLRLLARAWLAERARACSPPAGRPSEIRFDAVGVTLTPDGRLLELDHLEEAF